MTPGMLLLALFGAGPPSPTVGLVTGGKVSVVVFLAVDCPLARLYTPRLVELARQFGPRGVGFVVIASRRDSGADIARYIREHDVPFPVRRDAGMALRFGAARSPEAFVIDAAGRMRYRGRIDDQYGIGVRRPAPSRQELLDSIEAVLAGRQVAITITDAPGCPLPVEERPLLGTEVSYCREVASIIQRRCQGCHRPGQSGPFGLLSFNEAASWADAIREVVVSGRMPPWGANPRHGKFANDPSLTREEKETLVAWIDAGCPEGDRKHLPQARTFPDGWMISKPDVVVEMPESFTVPARGTVEYQYFRVDPGFREDRWIRAAEVRPGNPAVVHHCSIFLQPPGFENPQEVAAQGRLGSVVLTTAMQGTKPMELRDGMAKRIPAGWRIVFVVHYQAIGSVQKDRTRLGLVFADPKTVRKEVATKLLYDPDLRIPPRAANHRVVKEFAFDRDMHLLELVPHMHLRGKSFRYELIRPEGEVEILLDVPRFDFAWQSRYELAKPILVKAGSRLRCTAVYDNSADNAANPDPNAEVRAGPQTWDEMFNGYFDVCLADEDLTRHEMPWGRWAVMGACVAGVLFLARRKAPTSSLRPREGEGPGVP